MVEARRALDRALVKGVAWTGAASGAAQALSWVSTLVVVRLLTPEDYGIVGIAQVYLGLVLLFSEFGIGTAVVTLRELTPRQVAQLNCVAFLLGSVALGLSWLLAAPMSVFFGDSRLLVLLLVSSLALPVSALGSVSSAQIQRNLDFGYLASAHVVQSIATAGTTLGIAIWGGGYWALALGTLVGQAALSAMLVARSPSEFAWPQWASIKTALIFSRQVILERIAWYGYAGADRLVIGKVLGEAALGFYSVAQTLGMLAVEKISVLLLRVAPGVLSAVQHDAAALRRYLLSMTEALSVVTFPVSIGLALVADDIVYLMLGERWVGVIPVLQVLGMVGAYQSITSLLTRVLAVVGETRICMHVAWGTLVVLPPAFLIATRYGLPGVAAVWILVYPLTQIPLYLRLRQRIELSLVDYIKSLWPATSAALVMTVGIRTADLWPTWVELPRPVQLGATIVLGGVLYTTTIFVLHRERIRRFRALLSDIRQPAASSGAQAAI
jgi:PST family polysaccharide transporter